MKIHEILSLEPDRWCQNAWSRKANGNPTSFENGHSHCLSRWVTIAYGDNFKARDEARERLWAELGRTPPYCGTVQWNDEPGRTVADVIELCKKADV